MANPKKDALEKQIWLLQENMSPVTNAFLDKLFAKKVVTKQELEDTKSKKVDSMKVCTLVPIVWGKSNKIIDDFYLILQQHYPEASALLALHHHDYSTESENNCTSGGNIEKAWQSKYALMKATLALVLKDCEDRCTAAQLEHDQQSQLLQVENQRLIYLSEEVPSVTEQLTQTKDDLEITRATLEELQRNYIWSKPATLGLFLMLLSPTFFCIQNYLLAIYFSFRE